MQAKIKTLIRMRDVAFGLSAAETFGQGLNKIQLQKFIYLLDIVSYFFKILPPTDAYETYKNGPYDSDIQNAADCLAFRGFLNVSTRPGPGGTISARYMLAKDGSDWVKDLLGKKEFLTRHRVAILVASQLEVYGWNNLINLVYSEPTYAARKQEGHGQSLDITNRLNATSAQIADLIITKLNAGAPSLEVTAEQLTEVYFKFLDAHSKIRLH